MKRRRLTFAGTLVTLRTLAAIGFGAVLLPARAVAQSAAEAPAAVATQFFAALRDTSWAVAAAMLDSSSAQTLHDNELSMLTAHAMYRARDHGNRLPTSGGMTGVMSDGRVHADVIARYGAVPIRGFEPATTLSQAAALDLRTFLARTLAFSAAGLGGMSVKLGGGLTRSVVGAVIEGDTLAHVLYRTTGADVHYTDPRAVEIVRLVRHDGRWWVDLTIMNNDIVSGGLIFMANDEATVPKRHRSARPTP